MDLGRAVVDPEDARIAIDSLDRLILAVARSAEDLHRPIGDPSEGLGCLYLDHRYPLARRLAPVDAPRGVQQQQPGGRELRRAVGNHLLDELEIADRPAELPALVRVGRHRVQQPPGEPERSRPDVGEPDAAESTEDQRQSPVPGSPSRHSAPRATSSKKSSTWLVPASPIIG